MVFGSTGSRARESKNSTWSARNHLEAGSHTVLHSQRCLFPGLGLSSPQDKAVQVKASLVEAV